ncbi:MAG: hypothetical protein ACLT98_03415 [Eggerthellaceae bacterium]
MTTGPFCVEYEPSAWVTIGIRTNDRLQAIDGEGVAIPACTWPAPQRHADERPYYDYELLAHVRLLRRPSGRTVRRRDDRRVSGNGADPACGIAACGRSFDHQSDGAHAFSPPSTSRPLQPPRSAQAGAACVSALLPPARHPSDNRWATGALAAWRHGTLGCRM